MKSLLPRAAPALFATVMLAATSAVASAGPPAVCHPFQVKGDVTIPASKDGWSDVGAGLDAAKVVELALAGVAASDDALVHMETLRRAVVVLTRKEPRSSTERAERDRTAKTLIAALQERAASIGRAAATDPCGFGRKHELATFDVGFAAAAFSQMDTDTGVDYAQVLESCLVQCEANPAMEFGAALAHFGARDGRRKAFQHLAAAVDNVGTDEVLAANLLATGSRFFETHTLAELRAKIRQELEST